MRFFVIIRTAIMDNKNFTKLVELLEQESAARIASETSRLAENAASQQIISDLNATIKQLNETIGGLLEEIRLLKGPKKNSRNSSLPPSKDENSPPRTTSLRKSSGKSSGGQKGHEGSTLKMSACPEDIVEHSPGFCNCCGLDLQDFQAELTSCRQMVDIPVTKPWYTEHRVFSKTCLCGHQTTASFPSGVNAPISYGPKTTALIAYLHTRQYVPLARISEFFNSVYSMPISQGTVSGILDRFAKKSLPALELIKQTVCKSTVVGADETGMKQNGQLNWFWTWQNKLATYIVASANRGIATIKEHFPAGFPKAILVHDCWPSHLNTEAAGHQICTAYLLRELKFLEQKYQSEWATQFSRMLILALELKKSIPLDQYLEPMRERAQLENTLHNLINQKIDPQQIEVIIFQKRITKYRQYLFTFLYNKDVPPDNNTSEQAIRNIKVKQKVSGMFKSKIGAQNYATIRSVADTCIKNSQSVLDAFYSIAIL